MNKIFNLGIIIDTDLKIPPVTGVTYRLYYFSKKISESGVNVKIFVCNRNIKNEADEELLYDDSDLEFHILPEDIFYDPERMKSIIKDNDIDILQFEDSVSVLRYKKIYQDLQIPVVLEMHDVEASLKEMLNYCNDDIAMTNQIANIACRLSNGVVCMTPLDYAELIEKVGVNKEYLSIVPNPMDFREFVFYGPSIKSHAVIFIGNMFYWPNQNAAVKIIKEIIPRVTKKYSDAKFYFIGMVPDNIKKMGNDSAIFTGKVEDVSAYLKKSSIALCPVYEGSGMKVKILNYCAAGIPVITTTIGASGYEKVKSLVIENSISKYPEIINLLFENENRLVEIGRRNRNYIERYYDVDKLVKKIIKIYKKNLQSGRGSIDDIAYDFEIPLPLWLSEKRAGGLLSEKYYIIKNGKTILKKEIA